MKKAKIMILEDDMNLAMLIRDLLSTFGYDICYLFAFGKETIRNIEQEKPDILLMDIDLDSVIEKVETADRIHLCCSLPILFLTAQQDKETKELENIVEPAGYFLLSVESANLKLEIDNILQKTILKYQYGGSCGYRY
ncbi:MAG: response regulator [Candidatus Scalindua sp.]